MTSPDVQSAPSASPTPDGNGSPPVWSYRGYRLDNRDFTTAMVHFYRGEMARANQWRQRLDVTTNWALIATGAAITYAFGEASAHHSVILLDFVLVTVCLFLEARRYRYFELWSYRVRLIETNFYAALLVSPFHPGPNWAENLSSSLLRPTFPIGVWEAVGRRLHTNYIWIFLILNLAWVAKLLLVPAGVLTPSVFVARAHMGIIPGWLVLSLLVLFDAVLFGLSLRTLLRRSGPSGEMVHHFEANIKPATEPDTTETA